jgi:class 3 adenylate cyclase/pimeloyl-ACP methyl ester carboxylesterase
MELPEVRHVLSGRHHIAYSVEGSGETDLMYLGSGFIPFTMFRDYPPLAATLDRMGSFARVILTDRRGVGSSDPITAGEPGLPHELANDLAAILVAAGSTGATIFAEGLAVPAAIELAATHPKRVTHLVLFNGFAKQVRSDDYPHGLDGNDGVAIIKDILDGSDSSGLVELLNPDIDDTDLFHRFSQRGGQIGASRGSAEAIYGALSDVDVRHRLPEIQVPTLVLHRRGARFYTVDQGLHLADNIPDATFVELPGSNQLPYLGETHQWLTEVERFVTGTNNAAEGLRTMTTMLFTDIVASTELAADVGDRRWREILDRHDAVTNDRVEHHGGQRITGTGDGALSTFPMPTAAVAAASEIINDLGSIGLAIRAAIHTGEVEIRGNDIGGLAVNLTARVLDLADAGQLLVSGAVPAITIGSPIEYESRGVHELRGVPGRWPVLVARPG